MRIQLFGGYYLFVLGVKWVSQQQETLAMQKYKIAHVRQQGVDLIIAPLDSSFNNKSSDTQHQFIASLQAYAQSADLAGTVVPVWLSGRSMKFIAPPNYHPFFRSISWDWVISNINRELTCY